MASIAVPAPLLVDRMTAARMLGVSYKTIQRLVDDGDLRPVRVRRRVRYAMAELERFIAAQQGGRPQ
jgi:excisionase family DNA binding protein